MGEDCLGVCVVPPPRDSPPEFASSVGLGAAMHWPPDLWEGYDLQDLPWALGECPVRYARITQRPRGSTRKRGGTTMRVHTWISRKLRPGVPAGEQCHSQSHLSREEDQVAPGSSDLPPSCYVPQGRVDRGEQIARLLAEKTEATPRNYVRDGLRDLGETPE
jgi:hypothetical protein